MQATQHRWGRWLVAGVTASALAGTATAALAASGPVASSASPAAALASDTVLAGQVAGGVGSTGGSSADGGSTGTKAAHGVVAGCTTVTFGQHQQQLETALSKRAAALTRMANRVSSAKNLPGADATTLQGIISGEQSSLDGGGIAGLAAAASSATTCSQLRATAKQMVVDFRVYMVVARQVNIAVCSSGSLAAATRLTAAESTIEARITKAQQRGKDVTGAQQAFGDLQQQLSTATQELSGINLATVLDQVPSDAPGDQSVLSGAVATMKQADTALKAARADRQTIRQDLKSAAAAGGSGVGGVSGT
jgi:hypothetical protein